MQKISKTMALEIKATPVLEGKDAEKFLEKARKVENNPHKKGFSKQVEIARKILEKSK